MLYRLSCWFKFSLKCDLCCFDGFMVSWLFMYLRSQEEDQGHYHCHYCYWGQEETWDEVAMQEQWLQPKSKVPTSSSHYCHPYCRHLVSKLQSLKMMKVSTMVMKIVVKKIV